MFGMDEESLVKIRKYNRNVEISGGAMIMFGVWTVIRIMLSFLMKTDEVTSSIDLTAVDKKTYFLIGLVASFFVFIIVMVFHLSIGMGAIRYARGRSKRKWFLFLSLVVMLGTLITMPSYLVMLDSDSDIDTTIASIIVDLTMIFIQIDMISSVVRLEILKKKAADRG